MKIAALVICAAVCALILRRLRPEMGAALSLAAGAMALLLALPVVAQVIGGLSSLAQSGGVSDAYMAQLLKVALGTLSTATIFIANYYGKQSLSRKRSDHGKMAAFYARISEMLAEYGQNEALLERLAREELIENGNWLSYQRDNTPDISL